MMSNKECREYEECNRDIAKGRDVMKFTITNILSERSPNGSTTYYAKSADGIEVNYVLHNTIKVTKEMLNKKFISMYINKIAKHQQINVGDIV